ncbi:MAG: putative DNA binding domain-containing protein [Erysipelotrichaceae bacterium]|nr:putative DNA binding domain-containing protein [Erysipelotrichaceae bacterium]
MKYEESNLVELKRLLDDDMKSEIISFLNSYIGGTIYVGVDDDGSIYPLSISQRDENESKIINWIRDEAIYPNCSDYIKFHYNEDGVLEINIESGKEKPYYIKSKGLKPSGVYIRYGRNKTQATQQEIARMIRERDDIPYESLVSKNQNLTFITLKNKFEEMGMDFGKFKPITSGFIIEGKYTNVAYWFSDQYQVETKMAVYQGLSRNIFRSKKEYDGSIISQIDHALDYFDLCNEIRVVINGDPTRKEIPSYKKRAAREAILNCYCHRDFSRRSNIKIEFFDNRLEILSPGGFYDGLTLEKALNGEQSFRNEYVVRLLYKLGYIENYASGLTRIFDEYAFELDEPQIITSDTSFKVILPNKNYYALYKQPQNHIKDNSVEYDISGLFHKKD